jgi:hypothetical protein
MNVSSVKDSKEEGELMKLMKSENDQLKIENEEMRKEKKNLETGKRLWIHGLTFLYYFPLFPLNTLFVRFSFSARCVALPLYFPSCIVLVLVFVELLKQREENKATIMEMDERLTKGILALRFSFL